MKINFDDVVTEIDGKPAMFGEEELTLARACTAALINDTTGDGVQKDKRFRMAQKLLNGGVIELQTGDVAWLKEIVGRILLSTVHVGRVWQMLEQETQPGA